MFTHKIIKGSYVDLGRKMEVSFRKVHQYGKSMERDCQGIRIDSDSIIAASGCVNSYYDSDDNFEIPYIPDISDYIVGMRFRTNIKNNLEIDIFFKNNLSIEIAIPNRNLEVLRDIQTIDGIDKNVRINASDNPYATLIGNLFMLECEGMEGFREAFTSWYFRNTRLKAPKWIKEVSMKGLILYMSSSLTRELIAKLYS